MGMKPRPPKHPGEAPKRSGKTKVIWTGREERGAGKDDTRIIAIDEDTQDPLPCQVIVEYRRKDGLNKDVWLERSSFTGMGWLEKKLALEATAAIGTLPEWATQEGENKRDKELEEWGVKVRAFNVYQERLVLQQREAEAVEAEEKRTQSIVDASKRLTERLDEKEDSPRPSPHHVAGNQSYFTLKVTGNLTTELDYSQATLTHYKCGAGLCTKKEVYQFDDGGLWCRVGHEQRMESNEES